jgi:hypothetical protein
MGGEWRSAFPLRDSGVMMVEGDDVAGLKSLFKKPKVI